MYLAFDLGAESGRAVAGEIRDGRIVMREVHRFANEPVRLPQSLHWDVLRLWREIERGLSIATSEGQLKSIGVDTWGVDFALLGENGQLLGNPFHYRDTRADGMLDRICQHLDPAKIYRATGIQFLQINSLVQLYAAQQQTPELLRIAKAFLTIPDLFHYWLTGRQACEYTNATTTQMFDPVSRDWARPLLDRLGIPSHFLQPIVQPGTQLGSWNNVPVIAPASHDTGSAVAAIPLSPTTAYISSGTWSLMGVEIPQPILNQRARELNFTNEGGVGGTIRFLKNIMGMWLLQSCRKHWQSHSYAELMSLASTKLSLRSLVDPDDPSFLHPESMPHAIQAYCRRTGQPEPETPAHFVQCILESLALKYRYVLDSLRELTGIPYNEVRIVGGGAQNSVLNQLTADACNCRVVAGPTEATALGNLGVQMLSQGEFSSLADFRSAVDRSYPPVSFAPAPSPAWDATYRNLYGNRTGTSGV